MFHSQNRDRLYDAANGALIVLTAYDLVQQSGDMAAPFLQQSSFWWLTGITEPGWKLILDAGRRYATLVRPQRSEVDIIFNGESDDERVMQLSGIHEVIPVKEFESRLRQLHRHHAVAQTIDPKTEANDFVQNPALHELHGVLARIFDSVQDCSRLLVGLRAIKQPAELARMRDAIRLTGEAFRDVRELLPTLKTEAAIEAEFIYRFHRASATHAYEPIVAAGMNACTLHYTANDAKVRARQMILIDIGARVDGYSADITRTFCINPTKRQQEVYEAVQIAHHAIIQLIAPNVPMNEYIQHVDEIMKRALASIGLLSDMGDTDTYRKYFPHAISHGLGVDTHDSLGRPRCFEPGMVLTVEPGIYIPEEGIGVRIEDDILVTPTGHDNLSKSVPIGL